MIGVVQRGTRNRRETVRFASVHSLEICLAKSTPRSSAGLEAACSTQMIYGAQRKMEKFGRSNFTLKLNSVSEGRLWLIASARAYIRSYKNVCYVICICIFARCSKILPFYYSTEGKYYATLSLSLSRFSLFSQSIFVPIYVFRICKKKPPIIDILIRFMKHCSRTLQTRVCTIPRSLSFSLSPK